MKQLSQDLGISENVLFTGERLDIDALLADSDIFTCNLQLGRFSYEYSRGYACRLACLASDVGGVSESVIDGKTGYLVPRADIDAIKSRLADFN
uniref:glycosyltransferase n=1 Tax=Enterobacter cloacae complex sp. 280C5 TaxID=3395861 RepID=UPI003CE708CF